MRLDHYFHTPLQLQCLPKPSGAVVVTAQFEGFTVTAKGPKMAYTLAADKQVNLKVEFLDSKGNHATVDGDPVWSSSNEEVATVIATPGNPYLAQLMPVSVGTCQAKVEADADVGDGTKPVLCTMDVEIVGGEAVVGQISPSGEPASPSPGGPG